jgi:hypothetical protein
MAGFGVAFVLFLTFAGVGAEELGRFDSYYACRVAQAMQRTLWENEAPFVYAECKAESLPQMK